MDSLNRDSARVQQVPEGIPARGLVRSGQAPLGGRPVSVLGWSMAIAAGLLLWAIGFLLIS